MDDLTITTWFWGNKYTGRDVQKLLNGFNRHLEQPFRFVVITQNPLPVVLDQVEQIPIADPELIQVKGCFVRLRMFDPKWQRRHGFNGRIVCIDLDTVITGSLDPVFDRAESFAILQGANSLNPCKFCGALMMLRAGAHREVWDSFTLDAAKAVPFHDFPDDQGWLWHMLPNAAGWQAGKDGVYAYCKPGWTGGYNAPLPTDARLVTFNGWRSPERFHFVPWIHQHWR